MLEFLRRHHKTFWLVVTAIVIIAFTLFGSFTKTGNRGGRTADDTAIEIYDQEYSYSEIGRLQRNYQVAARLMLPGTDQYFASDVVNLECKFRRQEDSRPIEMAGAPLDFAINLLVLRDEIVKNGIRASDAEVKARFRQLPMFQTEGQFDTEKAEAVIKNNFGSLGMNEGDVYELLRDWIGYLKLHQVVSGNVVATPELSNQFYSATRQTIKVSTIPLTLESFKKDVVLSDDEIKKYYEEKKETFKTLQQRAASYVFFESPKDLDKLPPDQQKTRKEVFNDKVQNFSTKSSLDGANFDELAKDSAVEVKKVPAFNMSELPAEMKNNMSLAHEIFRNDPKTHPVSDYVQVENGYYFFKVTDIKPPEQQELKDAQEKVKETLTAQKAREAMMKSANDARKKLADAVKEGKKFEDAAKEAGLEPQILPEFSPADEPLTKISNGREIATAAQMTPPGSFTKLLTTDQGVMMVFVQSKELRKNADSVKSREDVGQSLAHFSQREVFRAWFGKRRDEANVKPHFKA